MADAIRILLAALDETIAHSPHEGAHHRAALTALAGDLRKIEFDEPAAQWPRLRPRAWDDLPWAYFRDGVEIVELACPHGGREAAAALLRYQPGASIPDHMHAGDEHIVVLAGSQRDERGVYGRGATVFNPAGSSHGVFSTKGCVVGIYWEKPVRFLAG